MYVCVLNMQIKNSVIGEVILLSLIGYNLSIKHKSNFTFESYNQ
jgi:hypothetical protein